MMTLSPAESDRAERVELILQQLHALPTLSPIATRLLDLTSSDQSDIREVVHLIESDPALTAKVLALCRRSDKGLGDRVTSVDRAVVMIGFEAVRSAVLSVEVYDLFAPSPHDEEFDSENGTEPGATRVSSASRSMPGEPEQPTHVTTGFDRIGFWKHSLGVAVSAELLAEYGLRTKSIAPAEAFVCGLLHGIGKLALDRLLPRSYERVVEIAHRELTNVAEIERRLIGVDHHTAGKRLAELWNLPHALQDVMWLYGQPFESLPDLPHREMIGLVSLADLISRTQHIGNSGNHVIGQNLDELCKALLIDRDRVERIIPQIHERVSQRAEVLGLGDVPTDELFLESIARANQALGRINESLQRRTREMSRSGDVMRAISEFHQRATPGQTVVSVCGEVVASAAREFGQGFYAVLVPTLGGKKWRVCQFNQEGNLLRSEIIDPPGSKHALESLGDDLQVSVEMMGVLPWLSDCFADSEDLRNVRLLPLRNGWGLTAILVHDRDLSRSGMTRSVMRALCETWASAIAAAGQHEGARRLGEQLAESNRKLTETQAKLARSRVMAALGEVAAGAAHEMNNPLTVISGRSQVLVSQISDVRLRRMAEQIVEQSHRLSDLITSLHLFADPPRPKPREVEPAEVIGRMIKQARERCRSPVSVSVTVERDLPQAFIDDEQIGLALFELIVNALEADPKSFVDIQIQKDRSNGQLVIKVRDDGCGMDAKTLEHAFDPFFSKKPAGRQPGLGLARAQRLVAGHQGCVELTSKPNAGTTAILRVSDVSPTTSDVSAQRAAAWHSDPQRTDESTSAQQRLAS